MEISAGLVKELREKTGAGMMDCKKALAETSGDFEKAIEYLRKKGIASAAKKAGRATKEGAVTSLILGDGQSGSLVEVNCETDFVARTEQFRHFIKDVATQVLQGKPPTLEALMAQKSVKDSSKNVEQLLKEIIATLGENMGIRRFSHFEATGGKGYVQTYIHGEGKVGVLVEFGIGNSSVASNETFKTYTRDISMHIAAASPQFVHSGEVSAEFIAKEKEIAKAQLLASGKTMKPEMVDKAVEGKARKIVEELCLLNQAFVKDPNKTVDQLTKETAKALGQDLSIRRFSRFVLGEGLKDAPAEGQG